MWFNNLNFSTEVQVDEESIQDKIDAGKLEIKQLTQTNLKKLLISFYQQQRRD
jgi:hypothetical protein